MKSNSFLVLLVSSVMLIAIASALATPAAAEDPIIVGKWDRTDGDDKYTIYANRTTKTVLPGGTYYGTWDYDGPGGYKYIFHWEHSPPGREPFIDYVTVAADGQSYSGYNNYGNQFHCVRVSDSAGSGGFPIFYVAVGGGIAAVAVVGAAAYYFFIAKRGAESAAGAAGSTGDSGSAGGQTNEVAFYRRPYEDLTEQEKRAAQWKSGTEGSDREAQVTQKQAEQADYQDGQTRSKLKEKVRDQINKTEQQIHQNRTTTQKRINEQMQQELKDESHTTQEVADSGESSNNAET